MSKKDHKIRHFRFNGNKTIKQLISDHADNAELSAILAKLGEKYNPNSKVPKRELRSLINQMNKQAEVDKILSSAFTPGEIAAIRRDQPKRVKQLYDMKLAMEKDKRLEARAERVRSKSKKAAYEKERENLRRDTFEPGEYTAGNGLSIKSNIREALVQAEDLMKKKEKGSKKEQAENRGYKLGLISSLISSGKFMTDMEKVYALKNIMKGAKNTNIYDIMESVVEEYGMEEAYEILMDTAKNWKSEAEGESWLIGYLVHGVIPAIDKNTEKFRDELAKTIRRRSLGNNAEIMKGKNFIERLEAKIHQDVSPLPYASNKEAEEAYEHRYDEYDKLVAEGSDISPWEYMMGFKSRGKKK